MSSASIKLDRWDSLTVSGGGREYAIGSGNFFLPLTPSQFSMFAKACEKVKRGASEVSVKLDKWGYSLTVWKDRSGYGIGSPDFALPLSASQFASLIKACATVMSPRGRRDEVAPAAAPAAPAVAGDRRRRRDWPGDRAGHRRAAKKGWARKRRASRAGATLARRRRRRH